MVFGDITGVCKLGEVGVCDPFSSFADKCNYVSWIEGGVIVTKTDMGWKYHLDGWWHYQCKCGNVPPYPCGNSQSNAFDGEITDPPVAGGTARYNYCVGLDRGSVGPDGAKLKCLSKRVLQGGVLVKYSNCKCDKPEPFSVDVYSKKELDKEHLADEFDNWIGIEGPFVQGGDTPEGCDCEDYIEDA